MNAGALPVKQRVVSEGYVSATLGDLFLKEIVYAGIVAILVVGLIVYLRYKKANIVLPLLVTAFSETVIVLGVANVIGYQLDLPAIAGILATLGTGVDQMVIITDEVLRGEGSGKIRASLSKRVSRAFAIIFASATTTIMAMIPLAYMQLGVLRGFAIVTIIGLLVGIFITRPTYAKVINIILGNDKSVNAR
ncbi:MAG TPA: preprotein translocase subunit SecD, partial [Candidatus Methanofastidiosa archaeon]|nr:preprotein translocase subunit SecD [Candidatus Methanofastidiosa archaeon]